MLRGREDKLAGHPQPRVGGEGRLSGGGDAGVVSRREGQSHHPRRVPSTLQGLGIVPSHLGMELNRSPSQVGWPASLRPLQAHPQGCSGPVSFQAFFLHLVGSACRGFMVGARCLLIC